MTRSPSNRDTSDARAVEILDCTLRDGSYAVDFQFTEQQIRSVLTGLEAAGVRFVELGHGLGLGAAEALSKPMLVPESRCFEIAGECLDRAAWGMFCIPGVATLTQLRAAAAAGMDFVRVGVDIVNVKPAEEFVSAAKELGMTVFVNLMKTNLLDVDGVIATVRKCTEYGADGVYLVDSVGGYLPGEVTTLFEQVRASIGGTLGFHGHNNLGLANANALAAVSGGATYVDTTIDGIGRSAGNAVTESVAAVLSRMDAGDYDYRALAELSEAVVRSLDRLHDDRVYQLVGGLTQTHSSFFPLITRCAEATGVDVFELMAATAAVERANPTETFVMATATTLAGR